MVNRQITETRGSQDKIYTNSDIGLTYLRTISRINYLGIKFVFY